MTTRTRLNLLAGLAALALAAACSDARGEDTPRVAGANVERGRQLVSRYGCNSCHVVPGVKGVEAEVGPPLTAWSRRAYIGGEVPNTPEYLVRWIMDPQSIEPGVAMPNLGVREEDARDIAGYLYTIP